MKTVGIIAEYNPFHNGHAYQLTKAKELADADYAIVVMSGNFVQRGQPAILEKSLRAKAALLCGADLVIELPVHYATASAEYFASGAAALLDKLGAADALCFGSECGDIGPLSELADALLTEDELFKSRLKRRLKEGVSYPQARNDALFALSPQLAPLLEQPNNILGLEYLKALKKRNSRIRPCTLSRVGGGYHDESLTAPYASALAIRESLTDTGDLLSIKEQVPPSVYELMACHYRRTFPVFAKDLSFPLGCKLIQEASENFNRYFDIDECFSDRLRKFLPGYTDYPAFCEKLKTKNITYARVSRGLLHILLNIYQTDMEAFCADDYVYYARILGFRKEAAPLLSAVKANTSIPLLSRLADAGALIASGNGKRMLEQDIQASHLYALTIHHKFHQGFRNEYQKQLVIL
ncbi:MAG: nucleotidyltransferase [Blautia sp.]|nr:nucleotidyltransferase [Blautia sp.]MCM1202268.1 nucleotidyltransferase [Bacteroides fragilis]